MTSAGTALIQLIPDAASVHSVKARTDDAAATAAAAAAAAAVVPGAAPASAVTTTTAAATAVPGGVAACSTAPGIGGGALGGVSGVVSLSQHFFARWKRGTSECAAAQRRFTESLAAYSLVTMLLQVGGGWGQQPRSP